MKYGPIMYGRLHGCQRDDASRQMIATQFSAGASASDVAKSCVSPSAVLTEISGDKDGARR